MSKKLEDLDEFCVQFVMAILGMTSCPNKLEVREAMIWECWFDYKSHIRKNIAEIEEVEWQVRQAIEDAKVAKERLQYCIDHKITPTKEFSLADPLLAKQFYACHAAQDIEEYLRKYKFK